jgi:hypothetical protein
LVYFYEEKLLSLTQPLFDIKGEFVAKVSILYLYDLDVQSHDDVLRVEKLCEIVKSAVQKHPEMVKLTVLSSNLPLCIGKLLSSRQQRICGSALRAIREMIGSQDDYYIRYMMKHEMVSQVLDLAERCRPLNNANYCACLEFFDCVVSVS